MTSYCNQTVSVVKNNDCCSPTKHTEKYSVTLTVSDTWIMPEVTETTVLSIPNCNNILPGSWLWNPNVGYLEVVKYNVATGDTVVRNIGFDGNARVGTVFPSCMDFTVTGPIYLDSIDDNVTCLAADFVSPEVGSCALMKVKSTANLKKDYIIAIEIYQYKVDAVIDNYTIRACNYGLGKVGIIEANCDGKCVPVRAINANSPCLQDEVHAANAIAVCVGGESKILVGTEEGQIATWSNGSGEWQLINSNIEVDCTVTTNYVNIIANNAGPYLLNVVSTAPFKVGDRITFNNEHDAYTVSEIVSDTQIRLLKKEAPTEDTVIDAGARLCIVDCCDWLPAYVENLAARVTDVENINATQAIQITNLADAIEDLRNTKENIFQRSDLLTEPSGVLDIDRSYHVIIGEGDATITLDTDLSKYDNTQKHFVVDGANVGTGSVSTFAGHTDDNTTGDRTLNFRKIKTDTPTKLSISQQGNDIVINNTYEPPASGAGVGVINLSQSLINSTEKLRASSKYIDKTASFTIPGSSTGLTNIIGTLVVNVTGVAYNDTHYAHPYSGNTRPSTDFSEYSFVANATNCRLFTQVSVQVGGATIVSNVTVDEGYFHIPVPNNPISAPNKTHPSSGRVTQTVTVPFALALASLPANTTIDVPIHIECPNATAADLPDIDDKIGATIESINAYVSAFIYTL